MSCSLLQFFQKKSGYQNNFTIRRFLIVLQNNNLQRKIKKNCKIMSKKKHNNLTLYIKTTRDGLIKESTNLSFFSLSGKE